MADNPQVRAGTAGGTITVAADEITSPYTGGAAQAQAVKILDGTPDGTTPAKVTGDGELVTFVGNQGTVSVSASVLPSGAATSAKQDTLIGHVDGIEGLLTTIDADTSALAGAVSGTEVQTDVVTVPADPFGTNADAAVAAGATGSISAKLRRISTDIDAIKTAVQTLDDTVAGSELQVDVVTSQLPTGAASAANQTTIIGHVDGLEGGVGAASDAAATAGSTGSLSAKLRLVTSQLDAIQTSVQTLDNAIAGSEMQVDVVAALPAGDNLVGRVKITDGTDVADILDLSNSNPLVVAIVDDNGNQVTSFGGGSGGVQYTEGDTDATLTGGVVMIEESGDTVRAVSAGHPMPVAGTITTTLGGTALVQLATAGTVVVSSAPTTTVQATNLDIRDLTSASDSVAAAQSGAWNVGGTVNAVQSGAWNTGGTITKGSAVMGLGYLLGGTQITLTASGTVIAAVASKTIYVTHEAFTVQGGTVTITARNGNGGGTLWGPMQFSPTGGMAVAAPLEQGGLYQTVSGSAVYYELVGSGTVGGRIRWAVA